MKYMKFLFVVFGVFASGSCAMFLMALPALADSVSPSSVQQGVSTYVLVDCANAYGRSDIVANIFSSAASSLPVDPSDNGSGIRCNTTPHFLTMPATLPNGTYYVDVYSTDGLYNGGNNTKAEVEASAGFFETMDVTVTGGSVSAPTVTAVTPSSGTTIGGTQVTITGTGFAQGASVTIGGAQAASITVSSDGTSVAATTLPMCLVQSALPL